jgi:hypothetical protein
MRFFLLAKEGAMRRAIAAVAAAVLPLLLLAAPASAATARLRVHLLSRCTASGEFATCVTGGTTGPDPTNIRVHVLSGHAGQRIYSAWDMTCAKGFGAGSRSGAFFALTQVNRRVPQPYAHPDYCIVSADAQLQGTRPRWIEVEITYWD